MGASGKNFDECWDEIYARGKMLNKYPHDRVVSLTFKYFGHVADKSKIKVLDLGCGAGNNSWFFAREGFCVTGIDASRVVVEHAKKRFQKDGLSGRFFQMEIQDVESLKEHFHLVLDRGSLCTLEWKDVVTVVHKLGNIMHDESLFFSFFYNVHHPDRTLCDVSGKGGTLYGLRDGAFGGATRVTLLDENSVYELFSDFEILELYNHKDEPIKTRKNGLGGTAQYIIVAKKK